MLLPELGLSYRLDYFLLHLLGKLSGGLGFLALRLLFEVVAMREHYSFSPFSLLTHGGNAVQVFSLIFLIILQGKGYFSNQLLEVGA